MANLKFWNLEARTGVRKLPDPVQNQVNHLLIGKGHVFFQALFFFTDFEGNFVQYCQYPFKDDMEIKLETLPMV